MKSKLVFASMFILLSVGCAKFSVQGARTLKVDPPETKPEEPGEPEPPQRPFLQLVCNLKHKGKTFTAGRVGMLDASGENFKDHTYDIVPFAQNDEAPGNNEFRVWAYFPNLENPDKVHVWTYIFVRPSWQNPEQYWEEYREQNLEFTPGSSFNFKWYFTDAKLKCVVQKPPL